MTSYTDNKEGKGAHMESMLNTTLSGLLGRLGEVGFIPEITARPLRCRALIFNHDGSKVIGIARHRPGEQPYVVYPGGGLEETDKTPLAGLRRELEEELGLSDEDVTLTGVAIEYDKQYFYIGYTPRPVQEFTVGGPEALKDVTVSGTYSPAWFDVSTLAEKNAVPLAISQLVIDSSRHE